MKELQELGLVEAISGYRHAQQSVSKDTGIDQPIRSLEVARRFVKDKAEDSSGILIDLGVMHAITGIVPESLTFITDPRVAADLLRHQDFTSLSSDHPIYQAFKPYVGEYIVFKYGKDEWLEDRKPAAHPFSQREMDHDRSEEVSRDALDSVMTLSTNDALPPNWIKYLTSYQVVKHVTGHEVDPEILSDAVDAHTNYTGRTLREIMLGALPKSVGKIVTFPTLKNYHRLKHEIVQGMPAGIVKDVLENMSEEKRDQIDVTASLIGGLSTLRSFMENILYVLAKNPELQTQALHDPSLIKGIMQETARVYPAAPYVLRKTIKDIPMGDSVIPKESLVVFGIFAYGVNSQISNPDEFNPRRVELDSMFNTQGGAANVFSYGPRACLGRYLGSEILESTTKAMIEDYEIRCSNDPILMIGKGIGSRFDRPVKFELVERSTGREISAISSK